MSDTAACLERMYDTGPVAGIVRCFFLCYALIVIIIPGICCNRLYAQETRSWPIRVSANGHTLEESDGKPFFYLADTAWRLFPHTSFEEAQHYFTDRAAKGFTVIHAPLLMSTIELVPATVTQPDSAHFDKCRRYVEFAKSLGLAVNIIPAWMGSNGKLWAQVFENQLSEAEIRKYAQFVAQKFGDLENVMYSLGGDYSPSVKGQDVAAWMGETLKQYDPDALVTYFPMGGGASSRWFHFKKWLDFNFIEIKGVNDIRQFTFIRQDYAKTPAKPTILGEWAYEYEYAGHRWPQVSAAQIRRSAYLSVLSGAMGYQYGRRGLWHFNAGLEEYPVHKPWQDLLDCKLSPGSCDMSRMVELLKGLPWETFIPDHNGTFAGDGADPDSIHCTASAVTADRRTAIAYFPVNKTTSFDLQQLRGSRIDAAWFDPTNGAKTAVWNSPYPPGVTLFTPPGMNARGAADWVLILKVRDGE